MKLTQEEFQIIAQALNQPIQPLAQGAIEHIQKSRDVLEKLSTMVEGVEPQFPSMPEFPSKPQDLPKEENNVN